jgi:hypothetical protein
VEVVSVGRILDDFIEGRVAGEDDGHGTVNDFAVFEGGETVGVEERLELREDFVERGNAGGFEVDEKEQGLFGVGVEYTAWEMLVLIKRQTEGAADLLVLLVNSVSGFIILRIS